MKQECPACGKKVTTKPHENGSQVVLHPHNSAPGVACTKTLAPRQYPRGRDRNGKLLHAKDDVIYRANGGKGKKMDGRVWSGYDEEGKIAVVIGNDPFPTLVKIEQVEKKDSSVSEARDLKQRAIIAGIPGYERMKLAELRDAVEHAENPKPVGPDPGIKDTRRVKDAEPETPKKAVVRETKSVPKKRVPRKAQPSVNKKPKRKPAKQPRKANPGRPTKTVDSSNPFRKGCAAWHITEELMRGGVRREMITRLKRRVRINPWSKSRRQFDYVKEMDKRILMVAAELQNEYGFVVTRNGQGANSRIKAVPKSARKTNSRKSTKKVPSKKVAKRSKKVASSK